MSTAVDSPSPLPASEPQRWAVIGAGLSGALLARELHERGLQVTLFDKGRSPGGRLTTRFIEQHSFALGAPKLAEELSSGQRRALTQHLSPSLKARLEASSSQDQALAHELLQELLSALPAKGLLSSAHIEALERTPSKNAQLGLKSAPQRGSEWWLTGRQHQIKAQDEPLSKTLLNRWGPFDVVAISAPAPQAAALVQAHHQEWARAAQGVRFEPCCVAVVLFESPLSGSEQLAEGELQAHPVFKRLQRAAPLHVSSEAPLTEGWTLYATPSWSQAHLELSREAIAEALLKELTHLIGSLPAVIEMRGHRWRYSQPSLKTQPLESIFEPDLGLALLGDWTQGRGGGAAIESVSRLTSALDQG
jgi:renalase